MSYSFREPECPAYCECKYDEELDEMNREDCPFHCDVTDSTSKESSCTEGLAKYPKFGGPRLNLEDRACGKERVPGNSVLVPKPKSGAPKPSRYHGGLHR